MKRTIMYRFYAPAMIATGLLLGAGCGGSTQDEATEQAIEATAKLQGQDVNVELNSGTDSFEMSAKTDEGTMKMQTGEGTQMPDSFPKDIPLFEGFTPAFVQSLEEKETYSIQGTVNAPVDSVGEFYTREAAAQGWEETMRQQQAGEMQTLMYKKDDRVLTVMVIRDQASAHITITTARE